MGKIDYNSLTECSTIEVKFGDIVKSFNITTEKTLTHGHGMPGEYGFDLSKEEKAVVEWFVEKFKIEDCKQDIEKMFEEADCKLTDFNSFILSLNYFKLWTVRAKKTPGFPDLTVSGKYGGIDYTLSFRNRKLIHVVNHYHLTYNEKGLVAEKRYYGITNEPGYWETYKYNEKGKRIETCSYDSYGNISQLEKYNNKGVRLEYYDYDDNGKLLCRRISDDNDNLLEEYSCYGGKVQHYIYSYNDDGSDKEECSYNADNKLIYKKEYDKDCHITYFYNEKDGRLERVCKFDQNDDLVSESIYNQDGSIEKKQKRENSKSLVSIRASDDGTNVNKGKSGDYRDFFVRIKNRIYHYFEEDGTIIGSCHDLSNLGFENKFGYYKSVVGPKEIDSAYSVSASCTVYKGCLAKYVGYDDENKLVFIELFGENGKMLGLKPVAVSSDNGTTDVYQVKVPESEVTDIYEIREAVAGFPFKTPKIVFLKENGVWNNNRSLGTLLADDEEISDCDFHPTVTAYQQNISCDIDELKAEANKGNFTAQLYLGIYYQFGSNVKQSYKQAFKYFKLAAEQGEPMSQNCVGYYYSQGLGVEKNDSEAFDWFSKSALQGNMQALCNMGRCYRLGIGVEQDMKKAVEYYEKLVNIGHAIYGYRNMAHLYYAKNDYVKAMIYWLLAASNNDVESIFNLGILFFYGKGTPANYKKAISYFSSAMQYGHRQAEFMVGYCYKEGYGVDQDLNIAEQYLQDAAEAENEDAKVELKELKKLKKTKKASEKSSENRERREYDIKFDDKFIGYGE